MGHGSNTVTRGLGVAPPRDPSPAADCEPESGHMAVLADSTVVETRNSHHSEITYSVPSLCSYLAGIISNPQNRAVDEHYNPVLQRKKFRLRKIQ